MSESNGNGMGELAAALAKAQAAFPKFVKDRTAEIASTKGSYSYKYGDLASLIEVVRKPLADNGLAYVQLMEVVGEGHHILLTRLLHTSGACLDSRYALASHDRPQEMGSEITYARRYTLSALLGVASEQDDDGAAAQGGAGQRKVPGYYQRGPGPSGRPAEDIGRGKPAVVTTDAEAAEALPLIASPAAGAAKVAMIETEVLTAENRKQRADLLRTADELAKELDLSPTDTATIWATYCGTATTRNVAVAALHELVSYLNLRLDKVRA